MTSTPDTHESDTAWMRQYSNRLVQTTLWIPDDMRKQLRIAVAHDDTTVSEVARKLFHDYLTQRRQEDTTA